MHTVTVVQGSFKYPLWPQIDDPPILMGRTLLPEPLK
jgi:hypothetical protein